MILIFLSDARLIILQKQWAMCIKFRSAHLILSVTVQRAREEGESEKE